MSDPYLEKIDRMTIEECSHCLKRLGRQDLILLVSTSVTSPLRLRFIDAWPNDNGSLVIAVQAPWERVENPME